MHSFNTHSNTTKFVQYTLNTSHSFGIIEDVNRHVQFSKKGHQTNTTEKLNIYKQSLKNNRINDILTIGSNKIFETWLRNSTVHIWKYHPYDMRRLMYIYRTPISNKPHNEWQNPMQEKPYTIKFYLYNKVHPCLNFYLNINTLSTQYWY